MGIMIDGIWYSDDAAGTATGRDGAWTRTESVAREWIKPDGLYPPGASRYHLYIAVNCPWAHRTWMTLNLKQLNDAVAVSFVAPRKSDQGWIFDPSDPAYRDAVMGKSALHEVYSACRPDYSGRVTVPLLIDTQSGTLVSNESADIILMFNDAFTGVAGNSRDLYPAEMREEIDSINDRVYRTLNNGVYRAGFATAQEPYETAVAEVFETLDWLETVLQERRYVAGNRLTLADIRLVPTLFRFDVAYHTAFKCNIRRLIDYPNLWGYTRELAQMPGITETLFPDTYRTGYHSINKARNPYGIIPAGPAVDFTTPHSRDHMHAAA